VTGFAHLGRIALALTSLSCVILLGLDLVGLIPNHSDRLTQQRMSVAEAMITQATVSATLEDMTGLRSLLEVSTRRNDDVRSVALRDNRGRVLMSTHEHSSVWADAPADGSRCLRIRLTKMKLARNPSTAIADIKRVEGLWKIAVAMTCAVRGANPISRVAQRAPFLNSGIRICEIDDPSAGASAHTDECS
jgi:hypothetical protein